MPLPTIDWWNIASALFGFATPKTVVIKDIRLGVLLRALQLLVVGYTLYDVLTKGSYLVIETPTGLVIPRGDDTEAFKNLSLERALNYTYCKNNTDYWIINGEESSTFIRCLYQRGGLWRRQGDSISYNTFVLEDKLWYVRAAARADCDDDGTRWLPDANYNKVRYAAGSCIYRRTRNWFPVGIEMLNMSFWHSFTTSRVNAYGSLPRTVIRRKGSNKDLRVFHAGKQPSLTISQWLQYAGIDLDKRLDEQPFLVEAKKNGTVSALVPDTLQGNLTNADGDKTGKNDFPYARVTGVQLVLNVQYYNYHMWPGTPPNTPKTKRGEILCVVEMAPILTYAGLGSTVYYLMDNLTQPNFQPLDETARTPPKRNKNDSTVDFSSTELSANGVIFQFVVGGALGKFSFSNLLTIFTRAAVLLGIAHTICLYVAKFALGTVSSLYNEFTTEQCSYRREYARFAAQAIVAGFMFLSMDKDNTGCLDKSEMYNALQRVLGNTLKEDELAKLTDFMLRHGDEDEGSFKRAIDDEAHLRDNNGKISLVEWVDIFTEDKANIRALKRILESEYKKVAGTSVFTDYFGTTAATAHAKEASGELPVVSKDAEAPLDETNGSPPVKDTTSRVV